MHVFYASRTGIFRRVVHTVVRCQLCRRLKPSMKNASQQTNLLKIIYAYHHNIHMQHTCLLGIYYLHYHCRRRRYNFIGVNIWYGILRTLHSWYFTCSLVKLVSQVMQCPWKLSLSFCRLFRPMKLSNLTIKKPLLWLLQHHHRRSTRLESTHHEKCRASPYLSDD